MQVGDHMVLEENIILFIAIMPAMENSNIIMIRSTRFLKMIQSLGT